MACFEDGARQGAGEKHVCCTLPDSPTPKSRLADPGYSPSAAFGGRGEHVVAVYAVGRTARARLISGEDSAELGAAFELQAEDAIVLVGASVDAERAHALAVDRRGRVLRWSAQLDHVAIRGGSAPLTRQLFKPLELWPDSALVVTGGVSLPHGGLLAMAAMQSGLVLVWVPPWGGRNEVTTRLSLDAAEREISRGAAGGGAAGNDWMGWFLGMNRGGAAAPAPSPAVPALSRSPPVALAAGLVPSAGAPDAVLVACLRAGASVEFFALPLPTPAQTHAAIVAQAELCPPAVVSLADLLLLREEAEAEEAASTGSEAVVTGSIVCVGPPASGASDAPAAQLVYFMVSAVVAGRRGARHPVAALLAVRLVQDAGAEACASEISVTLMALDRESPRLPLSARSPSARLSSAAFVPCVAEAAAALAEDGFDTGAVPIAAPAWPLHSALLSVWHTRRVDSVSGLSTPWPSGDAASIHLLHGPSGAGVEASFRRDDVAAPSSLLEDAGSDIPVELLSMHIPPLLSAAQVCA